MSFEKVNVSKLKNAISSCKNNISFKEADIAMRGIEYSNIWECNSREKLSAALNKLVNTQYNKLKKELDNCTTIANLISDYKNLEDENDSYEAEISKLKGKLYFEKKDNLITKSITNSYVEERIEMVKDTYVESQIEKLKKKIKQNNERMKDLEKRVSNLTD